MKDSGLPDFEPRGINDEINISIPAWMACMFVAESRNIGVDFSAIPYVSNLLKRELFTQRTISEQEAAMQREIDLHKAAEEQIRNHMGLGIPDDFG